MQEFINKIIEGDCLEKLKSLPDQCVDCCITSPPYFGLRDYQVVGQLGLEDSPELYIEKMVAVFREVKRVLKKDGTLWLNIGDSYAGSWGNYGGENRGKGTQREIANGSQAHQKSYDGLEKFKPATANKLQGIKPKDLIGIPWMLAFALRADGWYLRQDIIWNKPNPMPESVTDRCTKSHEYIFLLSKSAKYYYDAEAIKTKLSDSSINRYNQDVENQKGSYRVPGKTSPMKAVLKGYHHRGAGDKKLTGHSGNYDSDGNLIGNGMANKRSVWTVTTKSYFEAHFATFPEDLIVDCIRAGTSWYGYCSKCGRPYQRMVEKVSEQKFKHHGYENKSKTLMKETRGASSLPTSMYVTNKKDVVATTGWSPSCNCNADIQPGLILDPFIGAGTTAVVARKHSRNFIGIELNPEYISLAEKRLRKEFGVFL